jgi:hypothetical protein
MQGERARLRTKRGWEYIAAKQGLQGLATAQLAFIMTLLAHDTRSRMWSKRGRFCHIFHVIRGLLGHQTGTFPFGVAFANSVPCVGDAPPRMKKRYNGAWDGNLVKIGLTLALRTCATV